MAKVLLDPIGSPRDRALDMETFAAQRGHISALNAEIQRKRDEVRAGWGPEYAARVRKKGKLPTWDRIDRLKDADSPVLPIGTLVNYGRTFGEDRKTSPGAGVVVRPPSGAHLVALALKLGVQRRYVPALGRERFRIEGAIRGASDRVEENLRHRRLSSVSKPARPIRSGQGEPRRSRRAQKRRRREGAGATESSF